MISGEERDSGTIVRFASEGLSFGRIARVIISKTFVSVSYTHLDVYKRQRREGVGDWRNRFFKWVVIWADR